LKGALEAGRRRLESKKRYIPKTIARKVKRGRKAEKRRKNSSTISRVNI